MIIPRLCYCRKNNSITTIAAGTIAVPTSKREEFTKSLDCAEINRQMRNEDNS